MGRIALGNKSGRQAFCPLQGQARTLPMLQAAARTGIGVIGFVMERNG